MRVLRLCDAWINAAIGLVTARLSVLTLEVLELEHSWQAGSKPGPAWEELFDVVSAPLDDALIRLQALRAVVVYFDMEGAERTAVEEQAQRSATATSEPQNCNTIAH